jgi:tRNA (guanine37-N1)-methyltransferase
VTFDLVTIFPNWIRAALGVPDKPTALETPLGGGVVKRAIERGLVTVNVHDLRDFTSDRHRVVDDVPYGGGPGMVLKAEPLFNAVEAITATHGVPSAIVLTSPQGRRFTQREAERLAGLARIVVLCGRYEGVDERVRAHLATEELSIGDYILTGGELPALVIVDAVARLVPGVVGDGESVEHESFARGLLDFPQYTRPAAFRNLNVPEVLLSGHHADIRRWRKRQAIERTLTERPDLLEQATLDDEERAILEQLRKDGSDGRR